MGVSVGRGVSVGKGAIALAVAKAACPVNPTTVEMKLGGKGVGVDSKRIDCEQADKSVRMDATIRILCFMGDWNQYPAGFNRVNNFENPAGCIYLQTVNIAVFVCQIADVSSGVDL
jgi:hypothetical protein